jgi:enoyl-CoA hydratase/carnithine racemase
MAELVLFELRERVALLTLNRPEKMNAFNKPLLADWLAAMTRCERDAAVRAVVITGAGKAFCSGGDIDEMADRVDAPAAEQKAYLWEHVYPVARAIRDLSKPVIAAVNGAATGAGMDMALWCDLRVAGERARFAETYIKVGLVPGDGGAWLLPKLIGVGRALELLWTGDAIDARRALELGLVNQVLPDAELVEGAIAYAARLARGPAQATGLIKRALYQSLTIDHRTHLDLISSHFGTVAPGPEHREGVKAFLEKRIARFD